MHFCHRCYKSYANIFKHTIIEKCLFQISDETNVLQDGTLINLCGATLLWRSHEGLEKSLVS